MGSSADNDTVGDAMRRKDDSRNRQSGVAAVEFALVLPLLLTLVMGAIDWGWFFFIDQVVTNSAREGARAGTVLAPPPTSTTAQAQSAAQQASLDFLERAHFARQGVVASYTTIGTAPGTDAISVTVTYPVGSLTGLLSNVMPVNARATAVMRWQ
jgi:Flp pilus assembly protein TadG